MKTFHNPDNIVEYNNGLLLRQFFLLDDIMLEVDEICVLGAEVMRGETVEDETEALLPLPRVLDTPRCVEDLSLLPCLILYNTPSARYTQVTLL